MIATLYFAQISDIHISSLGDYEEILSGRAAGFLATVLAELNRQADLDFVLLTGDLFNTPEPPNVALFQQVIQTLRKPYYIIPGNHDRRNANQTEGLTRHDFARLFNPQVNARPADPAAQNGYWSVTVKPGVQLIGLDSIRDADWGGIIDPAQMAWLEQELLAHADKLVVLASHHPFHPLAPVDFDPRWSNFVCDNGPEVLALLDRHPPVKLMLTGHHHQTKADRLGQRLHLACPALAVYPCAYRTLRLGQSADGKWHIAWQTHPVTNSDTRAEAREMMLTAWQKAGFAADFVEEHVVLAYGNDWDRLGEVEDQMIGE